MRGRPAASPAPPAAGRSAAAPGPTRAFERPRPRRHRRSRARRRGAASSRRRGRRRRDPELARHDRRVAVIPPRVGHDRRGRRMSGTQSGAVMCATSTSPSPSRSASASVAGPAPRRTRVPGRPQAAHRPRRSPATGSRRLGRGGHRPGLQDPARSVRDRTPIPCPAARRSAPRSGGRAPRAARTSSSVEHRRAAPRDGELARHRPPSGWASMASPSAHLAGR